MGLRSREPSPPVLGVMRRQGRGLNRADAAGPPAHAAPPDAPPRLPVGPAALPREDWLALFGAVTECLQRLASGGGAMPAAGPTLQECVDALRQLRLGPAQGPPCAAPPCAGPPGAQGPDPTGQPDGP